MKEKLQEKRQAIEGKVLSDNIHRAISEREKERPKYEKRWFWELLQNAKDSVDTGEKIKVKLEILDDKISFYHTGAPFELEDIYSLIVQGSSKDAGKSGKFGTGFMTTYLLSKEIQISGCIAGNEGYFNFTLNRNAADNKDFHNKHIQSVEDFENSIQPKSYIGNSEFQTKFSYTLDKFGRETKEAGLKNIDGLILATLPLTKQIESIEIIENCKSTIFEKEIINEYINEKITKWEVKTIIDSKENTDKNYAYILQGDNYEVCVCTEQITDQCEIISPFTKDHPRLFYPFPLIGTEDLGIPVIINSEDFDQKVERDGIYLDASENEGAIKNKAIIKDAILTSCRKFALFFAGINIQNKFELFNFGKYYNKLNDNIWFNQIKINTIDILSEINFLLFHEGENNLTSLKKQKIPYASKADKMGKTELIWDLLLKLSDTKVPRKDELTFWAKFIDNVKEIEEREDVDELEYVWGIDKIVDYITSGNNSLEELEKKINGNAVDWLNELYSTLTPINDYFLKKPILLNQNKKLRDADGIYWDECEDKELADISKIIQLNFPEKLISQDIKKFEIHGVKPFYIEDAISELKEEMNKSDAKNFGNPDFIAASAKFLKWLIKFRKTDVIKELKVLRNDREEYKTFPEGNHLLLSPKSFFGSQYPLFKALIRDKDCLHNDYAEILDENDFTFLSEKKFIHKYPLIVKKDILTFKVLEYLADSNVLPLLCDEDSQLMEKYKVEIEYSDFAYLTGAERHIIDRIDSQGSSLQLFKFLLLEAPEKDNFFSNDEQTIITENGKEIKIKKCLWVYKAKHFHWVYVNRKDENGKKIPRREEPSPLNLSELIKRDESLKEKIKGEKQRKLLSRWDIGVSELIRNTLPDEKKQTWEEAFTTMILSEIEPELVLNIFSDPYIEEEYRKRCATRILIERNQHVGYLVEKLFKELIDNTEGIQIVRKPQGRDYDIFRYTILDEFSDFVNEKGEEIQLEINKWLIEIKATRKDCTAMTEFQAETAVEKKANYALIVVELDETGPDPDIEDLRKYAKVISDIGYKIERIYPDYLDVTDRKNNLWEGEDGISVNFDEKSIRFKIDSKIWRESSQTIEMFIKEKIIKTI